MESPERRRAAWAYAPPLAAALLLGLTGIRWGLPSRERAERILPPGAFGPALHEHLESSWRALHERLGKNIMLSPDAFSYLSGVTDVEPGWSRPPEPLVDAVRSFHLRTVHDDEQTLFLTLSRMRPLRLELNPHFYAYGGAYVYALGAWLAGGAVLGVVPLERGLSAYLAEPGKLARMYLWGRLASVLAFVGCVALLLEIGRRHLGLWAGALAAAIFALSPGAVIQAHIMKPHMHWTFLAFLSLLLSLRVLREGKMKDYVLAGAAAGLAVGSVVSAWPVCLFVAAAGGMRLAADRRAWRAESSGVLAAAMAAVAVFFLTNPYWLLDYPSVAGELDRLKGWATVKPLNPLRLAFGPLRRSVTTPAFAAMAAGLFWAFRRGRASPEPLLCGWAALAMSLVAVTFLRVEDTRQVRYFLPMIGLGGLSAGALLEELLHRFPERRSVLLAGVILVLGNMALHAGLYAENFRLAASPRATHYLAADWLEGNVPKGETIGLLRLPAPSNTAYFRYGDYRIRLIEREKFAGLDRAALPGYLILTRPDYDERPLLEPNFSAEYEPARGFGRPSWLWARVDETALTANPPIEIYRRKRAGAI